jgi:hypothetical protein
MALTKPALANVQPGEPVTAQGWNTIVNGLSDLYDAVLAFGQGVLEVSVLDNGTPILGALVVAVPASGDLTPIEAVQLYGTVETYTVVGVTAGVWHVFVGAPGYTPQTQDAILPATNPLVFNLVAAGVAVPDLFGVALQDALAQLAAPTLNLNVDVILDVMGHEVPKTSLPPQYQNQPILDQLPAAGTVVDPASHRLRLVVATALDQTPVVTMPSLVGLTYDEVASVLSGLGLKVGKTTVQS